MCNALFFFCVCAVYYFFLSWKFDSVALCLFFSLSSVCAIVLLNLNIKTFEIRNRIIFLFNYFQNTVQLWDIAVPVHISIVYFNLQISDVGCLPSVWAVKQKKNEPTKSRLHFFSIVDFLRWKIYSIKHNLFMLSKADENICYEIDFSTI